MVSTPYGFDINEDLLMAETDWDGGETIEGWDYVINIGNQLYGYDLIRKAQRLTT